LSNLSLIPWWTVKSTGHEIKLLREVVESSYFNEGKLAEQFESKLKDYLSVKHIIMTSSGTTALFCALKSIGIGIGSTVAIPNMTFIATATAVKLTGAEVKLVDINPDNLLMSKSKLNELLMREKVDAIVPVHVSGRSCFREEIDNIAEDFGIPLIEDAAESFTSKDPSSNKFLGTTSKAGIFSLSPNKIITSGQGGFIATNDDEIEFRCRTLKDQGRPTRGTGGDDLHSYEGYNFKYSNLQAAVGLAQFSELETRRKHLIKIYMFYKDNITNCDHQKLMPFDVERGEVPLWPEFISLNLEKIIDFFSKQNIGFRRLWKPLSNQRIFHENTSYPNSEFVSKNGVWLPSSFDLSEKDLYRIVDLLKCPVC
jgi:perosamine synthetase